MKVKIEGMSCNHCVARVTKALEALQGIKQVSVSLDDASAEFEKDDSIPESEVEKAITEAGYTFKKWE